ncbi:MAG TPA: sodium:solute symporter family protein, partial [Acidobacteriota bacterium]
CCSSRWGGYLYFAAVFVFMIPYVAIQIRGVGIFLNAAFPETLPVWGWATVIVAALLIYSAIGGLKAIIFSDALQGSLLLGATWIAAIVCVRHFGGVAELFRAVRETNAALLSTPGPQGLFTPQFLLATFLVLLMLPVTQPQLTTRIVIMRDTRASHRMAVGVGVFSMLVILPTIAIGMYGAARYPDLSTADFLARVLLFDRAPVVGAAIAVGLIAAAMSTADSQIFALGTELRSLLSGEERAVLLRTKLAIVGFAAAALVFAIVSSDQLVLLARVSFAGTALLGPLILVAVLAPGPVGTELLVATIAALLVFLTHLADWIPDRIGPLRLDLLLLLALGTFAALSVGLRGHLGGRRSSS